MEETVKLTTNKITNKIIFKIAVFYGIVANCYKCEL